MDDSIEALSYCISFLLQAFADLRYRQGKKCIFCAFPDDAVDRRKLGIKKCINSCKASIESSIESVSVA